mgnify:CR=1 FL=1
MANSKKKATKHNFRIIRDRVSGRSFKCSFKGKKARRHPVCKLIKRGKGLGGIGSGSRWGLDYEDDITPNGLRNFDDEGVVNRHYPASSRQPASKRKSNAKLAARNRGSRR